MNRIILDKTLPAVFHGRKDIRSDVWLQTLELERGKIYLVEADSGRGKTSLCSYIIGHRDDYEGTIRFDARDLRSLSMQEWTEMRRTHLTVLFQDLRIFPELTALENIEIKNSLTRHKTRRQILDLLDALGIGDKAAALVGKMSFGQQQRVAFVRALAQPFDFMLADEPISHLDDTNASTMAELMLQEVRTQGAGLIITSIGKHPALPYDSHCVL
ncbi:MAG: ATP-binding cassette domain-containing protein [Bacteroidaceae bacterium]|nr:ATP-binding cassette domain-containing protein [Bacteroidaceae bacterium]